MTPRRYRLLGKYRTPKVRIGQQVECLARGTMRVVGLSDGRIQWPRGASLDNPRAGRSLIVMGDLARAVRREAPQAIAYWWGITGQTISAWRKALGVPRMNEGLYRQQSARSKANKAALAALRENVRDPVRRAKIAAARRGKPRPPHVIEAMRGASQSL